MKKIILALSVVIFAGPSFAGRPDRGSGRLAREVQDISARLNDRIQRNAAGMSSIKLEAVRNDLLSLRDTLSDRPTRPPKRRHSVRGLMERKSFEFVGSSLETLNDQCVDFYQSNYMGSVDDITVSVDFGAETAIRNSSSYWKSAGEVCGQIMSTVRSKGVRHVSDTYSYIVTGNMELKTFTFKGYDVIDINQQCTNFYDKNYIGSVDDIELSVNFHTPIKKHNSSSYWKSSFEVCQQIISELR